MKKIISCKTRYNIFPASLLVLMMVGFISIFSGIFTNKAMAAADATIYFEPATKAVNIGDTFTLIAKVNPGTSQQIGGIELFVSYDESVIRLNSITKSSAFNMEFSNSIPNPANGTATFSAALLTSPATYITTTSDIATFSFTALASGSTNINFGTGTQASAVGVDVTKSVAGTAVAVGSPAIVTYGSNDFANLLANWLQTVSGGREVGNVNTDDKVNSRDLGIMMSNWQTQ